MGVFCEFKPLLFFFLSVFFFASLGGTNGVEALENRAARKKLGMSDLEEPGVSGNEPKLTDRNALAVCQFPSIPDVLDL